MLLEKRCGGVAKVFFSLMCEKVEQRRVLRNMSNKLQCSRADRLERRVLKA